MKDELLVEHLEIVIAQMKECAVQHPKAKVSFDLSKQRISITYPLPNDYWKIESIKYNQK